MRYEVKRYSAGDLYHMLVEARKTLEDYSWEDLMDRLANEELLVYKAHAHEYHNIEVKVIDECSFCQEEVAIANGQL